MAVTDYSSSASLNTSLAGINIGEGMARADVNNTIRQLMADAKVESDAVRGSIDSLEAVGARDVIPSDFPPASAIDFPSLYSAGESPIAEVRTIGSPTVSIGTNKDLEVVSA